MVADSLWGSTPMMTRFMCCSRLCAIRCGRRGGHCYYEQGSPFLSHASSQCPTGRRPIVSHTPDLVGSREESLPPDTWTESGQTPALTESSSSRDQATPGRVDGCGSGGPQHRSAPAGHTRPVLKDLLRPGLKVLRSEEHTSELQSRPHLVC